MVVGSIPVLETERQHSNRQTNRQSNFTNKTDRHSNETTDWGSNSTDRQMNDYTKWKDTIKTGRQRDKQANQFHKQDILANEWLMERHHLNRQTDKQTDRHADKAIAQTGQTDRQMIN